MLDEQKEQELIRMTNLGMILPILSNLFKEKKDYYILDQKVIQNIRSKINEFQISKRPSWVLIEMTL